MDIKHLREIPTGSPPAGALNTCCDVFAIAKFLLHCSPITCKYLPAYQISAF